MKALSAPKILPKIVAKKRKLGDDMDDDDFEDEEDDKDMGDAVE